MDAQTYVITAEKFHQLIATELDYANRLDLETLSGRLPRYIALVNSMEYIRGDGFHDTGIRPNLSPEQQDHLYQLDYDCRGKLRNLIDKLKQDEQAFARAKEKAQWHLVGDYLGHDT